MATVEVAFANGQTKVYRDVKRIEVPAKPGKFTMVDIFGEEVKLVLNDDSEVFIKPHTIVGFRVASR